MSPTLKPRSETLRWLQTGERPEWVCVCVWVREVVCVCVLPGDGARTREILVWSLQQRLRGGQKESNREKRHQKMEKKRCWRRSLWGTERERQERDRQKVRRDQASREQSFAEGGLKIMSSFVAQWEGKEKWCVQKLFSPATLNLIADDAVYVCMLHIRYHRCGKQTDIYLVLFSSDWPLKALFTWSHIHTRSCSALFYILPIRRLPPWPPEPQLLSLIYLCCLTIVLQ